MLSSKEDVAIVTEYGKVKEPLGKQGILLKEVVAVIWKITQNQVSTKENLDFCLCKI